MRNYIEIVKEVFGNIETLIAFIIGIIGIFGIVVYSKLSKYSKNTLLSRPELIIHSESKLELKWEITDTEKRKRTREGIKRKIPYVFPMLVSAAVIEYFKINSYILPLIFVVAIILGFLVVYVATYIYPYKKRQYVIDDSGIYVARGKKNRKYIWEDFDYFFSDPDRKSYGDSNYKNKEKRESFVKDIKNIEGETFFLKLKPSDVFLRLINNVLVIYTEPDNRDKVYNFLSQKLTERNGLNVSFVHYQFK